MFSPRVEVDSAMFDVIVTSAIRMVVVNLNNGADRFVDPLG